MAVEDVIAKLANAQLPLKEDFENLIVDAFVTKKRFLKEIGVLKCYVEEGVLPQVYDLACQNGVLAIPAPLGPTELVEFARWCKTEVGKAKVAEQRVLSKLKRKAGEAFTVEEIAAIKVLDAEVAELGKERKRIRKYRQEKIAELQKEIEHQRREGEREVENLRQTYVVASQYVPISDTDIVKRHWDDWLAETGADPADVEKNAKNFREVVQRYGASARRRHKVDYCKAHLKHFGDGVKGFEEKEKRCVVDNCADGVVEEGV